MGWWPFKRKSPVIADPLLRGTREWLQELREVCEHNYDMPEEARRRIRHMRIEWRDEYANDGLSEALYEGLEMRAFRLLEQDDEAWIKWLDDLNFWRPGWRPTNMVNDEDS